jgi:hypothetical protein
VIVPLTRVDAALVRAFCTPCDISWYCFYIGGGWASMCGMIECEACLRCVFYDEPFEDQFLREANAISSKGQLPSSFWRELFPASLPPCLCGGRFRINSLHHNSSEWDGVALAGKPLCPICGRENSSRQLFNGKARDQMEHSIWVPYMNRLQDIGPNDGHGEPTPEVIHNIDRNDPEYTKPRLLVGQGLIAGQVTDYF